MAVDQIVSMLTIILHVLVLTLTTSATLLMLLPFAERKTISIMAVISFLFVMVYFYILPGSDMGQTALLGLTATTQAIYIGGLVYFIFTLYKNKQTFVISIPLALLIGVVLGTLNLHLAINIIALVPNVDDMVFGVLLSLAIACGLLLAFLELIRLIIKNFNEHQKVIMALVIGVTILLTKIGLIVMLAGS